MTNAPASRDRVPASLWWVVAAVAVLRALPFLWTWIAPVADDQALVHVGYIPKDFLQYLAFMRQAAEEGRWLAFDPYTTEAQDGRFFLPFLAALGGLSALLRLPGEWVLELARIPLLFGFFALLWRFLAAFLPDARTRLHACVLVALAGGIETLAAPLEVWLPEEQARQLAQATWQMNGWSGFAAFYNPLWIAGSIGLLLVLRPVLANAAPLGIRAGFGLAAAFFALWWVHPYSALAALAIAAAQPLAAMTLGQRVDGRHWLRVGAALAPALIGIALLARWQAADPVYRAASGNALGGQQLSPFWYPLTLGALGILALRGARIWLAERRPRGLVLLGWTGTVVLLHTSPILNGYHFAAQLHLPLCIAAAPALGRELERARSRAPGRATARLLLAALFLCGPALTLVSLRDIGERNAVPLSLVRAAEALASEPPGNALVEPRLGNLLPAFAPQHVWVGHHFLTPDYRERVRRYWRMVRNPDAAAELVTLVETQAIRYVVAPERHAPHVAEVLAERVGEQRALGGAQLFVLSNP